MLALGGYDPTGCNALVIRSLLFFAMTTTRQYKISAFDEDGLIVNKECLTTDTLQPLRVQELSTIEFPMMLLSASWNT